MQDHEFLRAFETGALPNSAFHHLDHVRLAWLYLRRDGPEAGAQEVIEGIKHFAAVHGAADRFHESLTRFWVRLVQHLIEAFPQVERFDELVTCYPALADKRLAYRHYRPETLASAAARKVGSRQTCSRSPDAGHCRRTAWSHALAAVLGRQTPGPVRCRLAQCVLSSRHAHAAHPTRIRIADSSGARSGPTGRSTTHSGAVVGRDLHQPDPSRPVEHPTQASRRAGPSHPPGRAHLRRAAA